MNRKTTLTLIIGIISLFGEASARNWRNIDGHAAITGGYRNDKITTNVDISDLDNNLIFEDNIEGNSIDIYLIGLKGHLLLCDKWLIKGFANTGEVYGGKYTEFTGLTDEDSVTSTGKISKGHTYDTSVGLGYLFSCRDCFQIGPIAGYAYSYETIKMPKIKTDGIADSTLSGLHYDMRWQGPWLGFDAIYSFRCFNIDIGYEYHWSHWNAEWTLKGAKVQEDAFSDRRKSDNAHGNVVFIDGTYNYCKCWTVGLGFKYLNYSASDGSLVPQSKNLVSLDEIDTVPKATWRSYQVQASIGYNF